MQLLKFVVLVASMYALAAESDYLNGLHAVRLNGSLAV